VKNDKYAYKKENNQERIKEQKIRIKRRVKKCNTNKRIEKRSSTR
jgi:hypothetical protein